MARRNSEALAITPDVLLKAYACGIFPMAESADDPTLHWIQPRRRGILPLDGFQVSHSLAKLVRSDRFAVTVNRDFDGVIAGCAAPAAGRETTWINRRIRQLCAELFERGQCHTVEVWLDGRLVGGLYGIQLGAAFFGESMFHRTRDASKVALVHLVARLRLAGFLLLDTQFVTEHLIRFGAIEVSRASYTDLLERAIVREADFLGLAQEPLSGAAALAAITSRG